MVLKMKKSSRSSSHRSTQSTSSRLSTLEICNIVEQLCIQQHRDSTRKCYYSVWKTFNQFFVHLDRKPTKWEDRLTLFVGYLIDVQKMQSSSVKSYISAVKAVLKMHEIQVKEDQYLLSSLTRVCRLKNDQMRTRLPIQKSMLRVILDKTKHYFESTVNQPYLSILYRTLFLTAYFGFFRVSELTAGTHQLLAKNVHIGVNKKKVLFVLHSSKTHGQHMPLQMIKVQSETVKKRHGSRKRTAKATLPCPYQMLCEYSSQRGGYASDSEAFFIFRDKSTVKPFHFRKYLKNILILAGFDAKYYGTHSLRAGRSCDLYELGIPIDTIKRIGRWKSNAIFRYLRN